jgi:1-aminocyclopropane-1-carboxylate deaminase/D-cysteine desulfhydrase-like pyridoxal-dependent ACC family enzyme
MIDDQHELTPVEQHDGRLYKRDDLFAPFADVPLSGGKVRQAMRLLDNARETIVEQHGGVVLTATGVHSPQGLIIARVCRELGLGCVIFVGATTAGGALMRHAMLRHAVTAGASLDASARVAYEPALMAAARRWQQAHGGAGWLVKFGIDLEHDPEAIIGSTAEQVRNVPASVRHIVVPTGAGITAAGVIVGAERYAPQAVVVAVQIAGYDRRSLIDRIAGHRVYEYVALDGIPYSRMVKRTIAKRITLDPVYESKAHDWTIAHTPADERTLFWIVGDSTAVRSPFATRALAAA